MVRGGKELTIPRRQKIARLFNKKKALVRGKLLTDKVGVLQVKVKEGLEELLRRTKTGSNSRSHDFPVPENGFRHP
jgi:hypothetical protein